MMILAAIFFPIIGGAGIYFIEDRKKRNIMCALVLFVSILIAAYASISTRGVLNVFTIYDNLSISFFSDRLSIFFALFYSVIWFLVSFFAFWYIPHAGHEKTFFSIYTMCVGPLMGLAFSENMVTFYMFFEIMTLFTFLLVIHERTTESKSAGYVYLGYSVFGAGLGLLGLMFMNIFCNGNLNFVRGGNLDLNLIAGRENLVLFIAFIMVIGFAGKAGMYPLHSWLAIAHPVAPAPASAVLSGLITKAGVFGVIRVCYYLVGEEFLKGSWVQFALIGISLCTIFIGSMIAYKTKLLKKRLAYSSVSQVSYVLFGIFLFSNEGIRAAFLHIISHAISKNLLFICAGAIIVVTGKKFAYELQGFGRKMPITLVVFTLASLNLIGIPPFIGFFSKWNLAMASLHADFGWLSYFGCVVLLVSAILTAGYLLPIVLDGLFGKNKDEEVDE